MRARLVVDGRHLVRHALRFYEELGYGVRSHTMGKLLAPEGP